MMIHEIIYAYTLYSNNKYKSGKHIFRSKQGKEKVESEEKVRSLKC